MAKKIDEHHDENEREMQTIKNHLDKQDRHIETMQKKLDEVLILLGGSLIGKTKGLVEVVDEISTGLEKMISDFSHAEKWRQEFKSAQADNAERNEKKRQIAEQREHDAKQKDKEIEALKRSSRIKNMIAAAAVVATVLKYLWDHFHG
jgi:LPS O-antigen subunit length determinant protein (WzzB/FepE family)